MIATLHAYILRELLKTFVLTLLALTAVFTMGGGLYNIVHYEGVTAVDVFAFIPLLAPIVVTLTMPMAALYAATMTYGRLAADNEFTACRAAGINVHRLFLPALALAIFVAAFTFLAGSYVIPGFMRQIEVVARSNLRDFAAQQLTNKGYIHREQGDDAYTLTAERVENVTTQMLAERKYEVGPGLAYLGVVGPTFLHATGDGQVKRFTVARYGLCQFDTRGKEVTITLYILGGRDFEVGRRMASLGQQQIGPLRVPLTVPFRLSSADLGLLLRWRERPWESDRFGPLVTNFLHAQAIQAFYREAAAQLAGGQALRLPDEAGRHYEVRAARAEPGEKSLQLWDASVHAPRGEGRPTRYEAPRAELTARAIGRDFPVEIRLQHLGERPVLEFGPRAADGARGREKSDLSLDGALLPPQYAQAAQFSPQRVLESSEPLPWHVGAGAVAGDVARRAAETRASLQRGAAELKRKITGAIHFRLGMTTSILVTLLMGAILGVIFRGARALAAFGLAVVPFLGVLVVMVLGRQLTESAGTHAIGPFVIWGGLATLGVVDLLVLRLGVRR